MHARSALRSAFALLVCVRFAFAQGGDECSAPAAIAGAGTFAFDTTTATTGADGQANSECYFNGAGAGFAQDVWFAWTATSSESVRLHVSADALLNPKLAVYATAGCPAFAAPLACSTFALPNGDAAVSICAQAGSTYVVQIGSDPGSPAGTGTLTIEPWNGLGANDDCGAPAHLEGMGVFAYDNGPNVTSTGCQGQNESACYYATTAIEWDLWFTWTAPADGIVNVTTCHPGMPTWRDTKLAIYRGAGCPTPGMLLACDDDCVTAGPSDIVALVQAGQTYTLQVGETPFAGFGGPGWVRIEFLSSCAIQGPSGAFCGPKPTSHGCVPSLLGVGDPSLSAASSFHVRATSLEPQRNGLVFFGANGPANLPFQGGSLCVVGPLWRLAVRNTSGSANCTGSFDYTLADLVAHPTGGTFVTPGTRIACQAWTRDPSASFGTSLSSGLDFVVCQ
ncbi:MAG: hypothetical protein L6Q99_14850 [Planctomycetes bacterium]|nr:hypothetical protein [Planctomycetota bacterium]